jgi:hypothetical protein
VEACAASKHNPGTEIMLLGVARASFEELLEDYKDFLRQRKLKIWDKDDHRALAIRNLAYATHKIHKTYSAHEAYRSHMNDPEKIANVMVTPINQTNFLLDRQIAGVKSANEKSGWCGNRGKEEPAGCSVPRKSGVKKLTSGFLATEPPTHRISRTYQLYTTY